MSYITIDGIERQYTNEKSIFEVIRKAGIELPSFSRYGDASRGSDGMGMVEDAQGNFLDAYTTPPQDGMCVRTQSEALDSYRKQLLSELLSEHYGNCTTCEKSDDCKLKEYSLRYGVNGADFKEAPEAAVHGDAAEGVVIDFNKCVLCGSCVSLCEEEQGIGAIGFEKDEAADKPKDIALASEACVECGQCAAVCPTGALTVKNETEEAWKLLRMDKKAVRVVVQISPAACVALGEHFGFSRGENVKGKITAALKMIGADVVADAAFAADLTVVEETKELSDRMEKGEKLPLFTSDCPAWVRYAERKYPRAAASLSSSRSPMQAFSAVLRNYYDGLDDGRETKIIAVTSCTAKKYEASRAEFIKEGKRETDLVLTTEELAKMFRQAGLRMRVLKNESPDEPFGAYSGAGVIFGVTGGEAEAVARCFVGREAAGEDSEGAIKKIEYSGVRGWKETKEAVVKAGDKQLKIAVVSGLKAAGELLEKLEAGDAQYDFVEVMACPGGCIAGGGQPYSDEMTKKLRAAGLYRTDRNAEVKSSELNAAVADLYEHLSEKEKREFLRVQYTLPDLSEAEETTEEVVAEEEPEAEETAEEVVAEEEPETEETAEEVVAEVELEAEEVAEEVVAEEEPEAEETAEEVVAEEEPEAEETAEEVVAEEEPEAEETAEEIVVEEEPEAEEAAEEVVAEEEPEAEEAAEEIVAEEEPEAEETAEEIVVEEAPEAEEAAEEVVAEEEPEAEETTEEVVAEVEPEAEETTEEVVTEEAPEAEETTEEVVTEEAPEAEETTEEVVAEVEPEAEETAEEIVVEEAPEAEETAEEVVAEVEPEAEETAEEVVAEEEPEAEETTEEVVAEEEPEAEETAEEVIAEVEPEAEEEAAMADTEADFDESADVLEEEAPLAELFDENTAEEELAVTTEEGETSAEETAEAVITEDVSEAEETSESVETTETVEAEVSETAETNETAEAIETEELEAETAEAIETTETAETETVETEASEDENGDAEAEADEDGEDEEEETKPQGPAVKVPYHTTLSRKERRKLKRMKKFKK